MRIASITQRKSGCMRKSLGMRMSSTSSQIGSRMRTVGQLSFCSHCMLQPSADDSWMIENTGMMLSKPNSV